jgi:large subunit ribosomal protein L3
MPGLFGNSRVTAQNLTVVDIKPERNLLLVRGAVPGSINSIVLVRQTVKKQRTLKKAAEAVSEG